MLIHLIPKIYLPLDCECELIDLTINELGLVLVGGKDITARKPYPNKRILVGCRKTGQKAIDGIFVETAQHLNSFTVITRWKFDYDESRVITHQVNYIVLDDDFETISASMSLWYAASSGLGGWSSRWPECYSTTYPCYAEPQMDVLPHNKGGSERDGEVIDILDECEFIINRTETFKIPTIERERLFGERAKHERFPAMDSIYNFQLSNV